MTGPQQNLVKDELEAGQGGLRHFAELEPFAQYMSVIEHNMQIVRTVVIRAAEPVRPKPRMIAEEASQIAAWITIDQL
ncbi:MAG: hypothetical protein VXV97_14830 [Pseudomonadota bacterium]|nr:hypothetical protein [Pseudomonadota bacterium]